MAPRYLSDDLRRIADIPSRGRLRSAATNRLDIRPARLKIGERAFASAGPRIWNSLLDDNINCQSLPVFRRKIKAHLFKFSYPDVYLFLFCLWLSHLSYSGFAVFYLSHFKILNVM